MKYLSLLFVAVFTLTSYSDKQNDEPWTSDQLMAPSVLAQKIENHQMEDIKLIHVGYDALIPGSIDTGPASEEKKLAYLKTILHDTPKDKEVVIYCGCCPFAKCPNIRPAFKTLNKLGFKNAKLLNLSTSIKADWLDKGYPAKKE